MLDVNVATFQLEHCTYGNHAFHDNTIDIQHSKMLYSYVLGVNLTFASPKTRQPQINNQILQKRIRLG